MFARKTTKQQQKNKMIIYTAVTRVRTGGHAGQPLSLALPQDQVHEATEEGEGEGHPGQDVGVAVSAVQGRAVVVQVAVVHVLAPVCVDGRRDHDAQTCRGQSRGSRTNSSGSPRVPGHHSGASGAHGGADQATRHPFSLPFLLALPRSVGAARGQATATLCQDLATSSQDRQPIAEVFTGRSHSR